MCYPLGLRFCTPHTHPHLPASIPSSARHRQLRLDSTLLLPSHLHLPPPSCAFLLSLLSFFFFSVHLCSLFLSILLFCLIRTFPFSLDHTLSLFLLHIIASTSESMSGRLFPHSYHSSTTSIKRHFPSRQRPCQPNNIAFHSTAFTMPRAFHGP